MRRFSTYSLLPDSCFFLERKPMKLRYLLLAFLTLGFASAKEDAASILTTITGNLRGESQAATLNM